MSTSDADSVGYHRTTVAEAEAVSNRATPEKCLLSLAKLSVPPEAVRALPAELVKRHQILPLAMHNGTIDIATAQPGNQRVIEDIRLVSGLEVR